MQYAISTAPADHRLWVLTRDDVQLGLHASIESAIGDALQQLHADRQRGSAASLYVNGVEVIVRRSAAAIAA